MKTNIPVWALRDATPEDHGFVQEAHRQGSMQIKWPNAKVLRTWAKEQWWPTPWFGFEEKFLAKMLETKVVSTLGELCAFAQFF